MDVSQQVIDSLFLPLAVFGGILLMLMLLVLRLTYQTGLLARRQRRMLTMLANAQSPSLRPGADRSAQPPHEPVGRVAEAGLLALPAADHPPVATEAEPEPSDATETDVTVEPINVRTDPEFGVIYSFRGKDYLSRVAADQARWRSLNQPAPGMRS